MAQNNRYDTKELDDYKFDHPGKNNYHSWFKYLIEFLLFAAVIGFGVLFFTDHTDWLGKITNAAGTSKYIEVSADSIYTGLQKDASKVTSKYEGKKVYLVGRYVKRDYGGEYFCIGPVSGNTPSTLIKCYTTGNTKTPEGKLKLGCKVMIHGVMTTVSVDDLSVTVEDYEIAP